jgi:outer membrane protein assembly factor BamE (lipoprotein component of BamABCDE complex)
MVTSYEYRCSMVSRPVTRSETYYENEYDYVSKSTRMVSRTRMVTHYESQNECRSEPVTRSETHYETKTETRYIPPEQHVTTIYDKDTVLIEAEPEILVTPHHRAK